MVDKTETALQQASSVPERFFARMSSKAAAIVNEYDAALSQSLYNKMQHMLEKSRT